MPRHVPKPSAVLLRQVREALKRKRPYFADTYGALSLELQTQVTREMLRFFEEGRTQIQEKHIELFERNGLFKDVEKLVDRKTGRPLFPNLYRRLLRMVEEERMDSGPKESGKDLVGAEIEQVEPLAEAAKKVEPSIEPEVEEVKLVHGEQQIEPPPPREEEEPPTETKAKLPSGRRIVPVAQVQSQRKSRTGLIAVAIALSIAAIVLVRWITGPAATERSPSSLVSDLVAQISYPEEGQVIDANTKFDVTGTASGGDFQLWGVVLYSLAPGCLQTPPDANGGPGLSDYQIEHPNCVLANQFSYNKAEDSKLVEYAGWMSETALSPGENRVIAILEVYGDKDDMANGPKVIARREFRIRK